jgi:O-antigen ligase
VQPWAVLTVQIWALVLGAGALWVMAIDPGVRTRSAGLAVTLGAAISLCGVFQLAPLPPGWARGLAEPTANARVAVTELVRAADASGPLSLSPPDTLDATLRVIGYVCVGIAALVSFKEARHLVTLAVVVACCGLFQAVYGSAEFLSGHQHIFWYEKKYYTDVATGTFINRNHFAGYLAMVLPFALILTIRGRRSDRRWSFGQRLALWIASIGCAVLIWLGVILSQSRAGLGAALVASLMILVLGSTARPVRWRVVTFAALIPALFLLWQDVRAPGERFVRIGEDLAAPSGRVSVWKASASMVRANPIAGTGLGTFEQAFDLHRAPRIYGRYQHAHNEYLQYLVEGGLVLTSLTLVVAIAVAWRVANRRAYPHAVGWDTGPVFAALAALAFHICVDFNLRIPAIAVLSAVFLGLCFADPRAGSGNHPRSIPSHSRHR